MRFLVYAVCLTLTVENVSAAPPAFPSLIENNDVTVLGVRVRSDRLGDVLHELGPPVAVFLRGDDGEGRGSSDDPVMMVYHEEACLGICGIGEFTFALRSSDYSVQEVLFRLLERGSREPLPIPFDAVTSLFGASYRRFRQPLDFGDADIEGIPRPCNSTSGELISLIFRDHGLQAFVEEPEPPYHVRALRFATELLREVPMPECPQGATPP